jgi:hypothetical protein
VELKSTNLQPRTGRRLLMIIFTLRTLYLWEKPPQHAGGQLQQLCSCWESNPSSGQHKVLFAKEAV